MARTLREDQAAAIDFCRESVLDGHRRTMLQAPCSFGKTVVSSKMLGSALDRGHSALFVVPSVGLIDQTYKSFWDEGITDIGVIQANHPQTNRRRKLQIASVKTLIRRDMPKADLVVIDEAHQWFKFYEDWMSDPDWLDVPFIGMSATPWTRGLGKWYSNLVIASTTKTMIETGLSSPFRAFAPKSGLKPNLAEIKTRCGDWCAGELAKEMSRRILVADVVENWLARGEDRPTLCFAVNRAHAKLLRDEFEAAGVATAYVDALTPRDQRDIIGSKLKYGVIKVVINIGCCTTGIDWDVRCIILARPTKSEILYVQIIGRGLRLADGKDDLLIFDHSDTTARLGFASDINYDRLDMGVYSRNNPDRPRREKSDLPSECPQCGYLKPPSERKCSQCGYEYKRPPGVITIEGELEEKTKTASKTEVTWEEKQKFYSMLLQVCDARKAKPGWAAYKFKDRFGEWPPRDFSTQRVEPTGEVLNWIKSRDIAFAKRSREAA